MTFTFETNGNSTFLVYAMGQEEKLDTMTLGMITKNKIPGMASVLFTQRNAERFLKYNVTARVTVRQFFSGTVSRRRLLGIFASIAAALSAAEEYMIDPRSLLLDADYIYADVSSCRAEMICLPVMDAASGPDAGQFFKSIMFETRFDQTESCDYVARIINYLNSAPMFIAEEFGRLVQELQGTAGEMQDQRQTASLSCQGGTAGLQRREEPRGDGYGEEAMARQRREGPAVPGHQEEAMARRRREGPAVPGHQEEAMARQRREGPAVPGHQEEAMARRRREGPAVPGHQEEAMARQQREEPSGGANPKEAVGLQGRKGQKVGAWSDGQEGSWPVREVASEPMRQRLQEAGESVQKAELNHSGKSRAEGFAIPGRNADSDFEVPGQQPGGPSASGSKIRGHRRQTDEQEPQEKGMSMLYLLQHYSKENAAVYKAQKQARKNTAKTAPPMAEQEMSPAVQAGPRAEAFSASWNGQQAEASLPSQNRHAPRLGQEAVSQEEPQHGRQGFQETPGGENFGDTVLVGETLYGENTVVVTQVQEAFRPYLLRCSSQEKIMLEKPVFRIGKERSYVDYCIVGNATVSRSHADIIQKDGQYYIVDNNSTNHTYVDGEMIPSNSQVPLVHGTKIRISNEEFEFKTF